MQARQSDNLIRLSLDIKNAYNTYDGAWLYVNWPSKVRAETASLTAASPRCSIKARILLT